MRRNPVFTLSQDQTLELKAVLVGHKSRLDPSDFSYIWLKLNRPQAVMTQRQLHRFAMTLIETDYLTPLPEWYHEMLEPTANPSNK